MAVLTSEDRSFWERNGYVVVHNAVPRDQCTALVSSALEFIEMDNADPESWYPETPRGTSMIEMYHHQTMWDNRQTPRLYEAFTDLHGTEKLWVSIDRVSMNPPVREGVWERELPLHWDMSLERPLRHGVQGVVLLTDTEVHQGGFECVPGFHSKMDKWLETVPKGEDPTEEMRRQCTGQPVPGRAGDLVMWTTLLPHGHGRNTGMDPRFAQYITMYPANEQDETARDHRIQGWRERRTGLAQQELGKEHRDGSTAVLSALGRKLLGLDRW
jgi:hypothetical protein